MTFGKVEKPVASIKKAPAANKPAAVSAPASRMTFGALKANALAKDLNIEHFKAMMVDHASGSDDYFIILLDRHTKDDKEIVQLQRDLKTVGIEEYLILSGVSLENIDSKQDQTAALLTLESDWRSYLTYKGKQCKAIAAAGRTIRILIKSADLNYYDFIDDYFAPPRFFCGSAYVGGPDKWIYPIPPIDYIYPFKDVGKGDFVNYNTRFFRRQIACMSNETDFSLDSLDARPIKIIDASEDSKVDEALRALDNADIMAIDTETSGFNAFGDRLGTVQMTADGETAYFFEWATLRDHKRLFTKVLRDAKRLVLANAKFDIRFLNANGVHNVWPTDDTTLLAHAMNSHRPKGLKPNTWFWCGTFGGYDDKLDMIKKKMKVDNYLMIPKPILMEYAAIDPVVTWRQLIAMEKWCHYIDDKYPNEKVPEWTIWEWYKEVMMPNLNAITKIELNGVFFDKEQIKRTKEKNEAVVREQAEKLAKAWGVSPDFEFGSTDKLGKLFEQLGWPCVERNSKGVYSTSDPVLNEYDRLGCPGIKDLKKYRSFQVAINTFCIGWGQCVTDHDDGTARVHQNTNAFGVVSFRHAMNDPNFQQIPARGDISHDIKNFFCNPPSHKIYEVEDDKGNKWDNTEYLKVIVKDGTSKTFDELNENDEIMDYDRSWTVYDTSSPFMY